jgi:adenylate cyclase
MAKEYHFTWQWDLKSSPEAIWPFAADTNRFNRDTGQPKVQVLSSVGGVKQMRMRLPLLQVEWEEKPFEWTFPYAYSVLRIYSKGPVRSMRTDVGFERLLNDGTRVIYHSSFLVSNPLVQLLIPFVVGVVAKGRFERAFRLYDSMAKSADSQIRTGSSHRLSHAGRARFQSLVKELVRQEGVDASLLDRLEDFLDHADDLSAQRIRPFALADRWHMDRRTVLEMFLRATRAGILDMSWDLLCPSCRGTTEGHTNLGNIRGTSHCNTCKIDFTVNFDHNIEVIFRPNPSVRTLDYEAVFCAGNPQLQPHVVMSQTLAALRTLPVSVELERGRHTLRASNATGSIALFADEGGEAETLLRLTSFGWPMEPQHVSLRPTLTLVNAADVENTFQLERTSWGDEAATAADVTALQVFRDLFASEVMRPGEEISIGSVTLMFTDLRDSTRMYRLIGDASAFSRVREHFKILEQAIAAEGGAIVKTMGDAVMATFRRPIDALNAVWDAQSEIARHGEPLLWLKAGLHTGPCIVVNQNDRLDYFGSTVNIAARLTSFSHGGELVFSDTFYKDPQVQTFLTENVGLDALQSFTGELKGFDEPFTMWKLTV